MSRFSGALAAGLGFLFYLWPRWEQITFSVFQTRDLERARQVLSGEWFFFGPEMTGGGHLPGGLYYYLLSLPLAFSPDWRGTWLLLLLLSGIAIALAWAVLHRHFGVGVAIVLAVGVTESRQIVRTLTSFNNASYALPFFILALLAICSAFTVSERERKWWWYAGALVMGLGAQIHMSIVLFFAGAVLVQVLAPRLKLVRLPASQFGKGVGLFAACWIPYLSAQLAWSLGLELGVKPYDFTGAFDGGPEFLLDHTWRQMQGFVVAPEMTWNNFFNSFSMIMPAAALLAAAPLIFLPNSPSALARSWCKIIAVLLLTTLAVTLPFVAGHVYMRYATGLSVALCALVALTPLTFTLSRVPWRVGLAFSLLAVGAFFYLAPRSQRTFLNMPTVREVTALVKELKTQTGWSFAQARERIFYVNFHAEASIRDIYDEVEAPGPKNKSDVPDGFFAVMESPRAWLQNTGVPEEIVEGVESKRIELGDEIAISPRLTLIPYLVRDKSRFPPHFHNSGLGYSAEPIESLRRMRARSEAEPRKSVVALFNNCPSRKEFCTIGLSAESEDLTDPRLPVTIQAAGVPISVSSAWISAAWTESLSDVYVSALCSGKPLRVPLAQALGLSTKGNMRLRNNSQLAPFKRIVNWDCKGRIQKIHIGYASSHGGTMFRNFPLAGSEKSFDFE